MTNLERSGKIYESTKNPNLGLECERCGYLCFTVKGIEDIWLERYGPPLPAPEETQCPGHGCHASGQSLHPWQPDKNPEKANRTMGCTVQLVYWSPKWNSNY